MKRLMIAATASLVLVFGAAHANPFDALFGNTATSTSPRGQTITFYFNPDDTFENHFSGGRVVRGTYVWKDPATACFTVTDPAPAVGEPATNCRSFEVTHHVGDVWTEVDSDGVTWTNRILPGRGPGA